MINTCPFIDFGMSCWFCVVTLVLYLLSEESTTALYLHFMSIQGNIMILVSTEKSRSIVWCMWHIVPTYSLLPLPPKKRYQFSFKVTRVRPCLHSEPSLLPLCIIHMWVSKVMQQVVNPGFQTNSYVRKIVFTSRWVFLHSLHAWLYVDSNSPNFVSVCQDLFSNNFESSWLGTTLIPTKKAGLTFYYSVS